MYDHVLSILKEEIVCWTNDSSPPPQITAVSATHTHTMHQMCHISAYLHRPVHSESQTWQVWTCHCLGGPAWWLASSSACSLLHTMETRVQGPGYPIQAPTDVELMYTRVYNIYTHIQCSYVYCAQSQNASTYVRTYKPARTAFHYIHTDIRTYKHCTYILYIRTYAQTYIHTHLYVHTFVCLYIRTYLRRYTCLLSENWKSANS